MIHRYKMKKHKAEKGEVRGRERDARASTEMSCH